MKEIRIAALFTALFILGGILRVTIGRLDFTTCMSRLYFSMLVLAWIATVRSRIVETRVRRLLIGMAALLMLQYLLQTCRYVIFGDYDTLCRYLWYCYYIAFNLVPVFFLFIALHLHLQENELPDRRWRFVPCIALFFLLLVLTNDYHQLIFRFRDDSSGRSGTYTHGFLFYVMYIWMAVVFLYALYLTIRKCRIPSVGKKLWLPLYFASFGALIFCSLFDFPNVGGMMVWQTIEYFTVMVLGIAESCIQLGLIPANSGYQTVFRLANKPVTVSDLNGTIIYSSDSAKKMFQKKDSVQIHTKPICGGSMSWAVDMSELLALNREIEKTTESIASRNEYLRSENALLEEQSKLAARNALYRQISRIVRPQLEIIRQLTQEADGADCNQNLARIVVFNTYIKRRSNMELLRTERQNFPAEELAAAVRESCEYLKLCGVEAVLFRVPEQPLSAKQQILIYETFESILEACLEQLRFLLVNISMQEGSPVLRMTLQAPGIQSDDLRKAAKRYASYVRLYTEPEEDSITITVTLPEGGDER